MKTRLLAACTFLALQSLLFSAEPAKPAEKPAATETAPKAPQGYANITLQEFEKMRAQPGAVVVDVRTKAEFERGHVPGAINLDVRSAEFEKEAAKLDKSKTYLVHCAAGVRSLKACDKLAPLKFEKLYNFTGGYGEWFIKAGK